MGLWSMLRGVVGRFAVGTADPDPSAALEVAATDGTILVPRMTSAQRMAIVAPTDGGVVYDTTAKSFYYREDGAWTDRKTASTGDGTLHVDFTYADDGVPVESATSIPNGALITDREVRFTEAFNGTAPSVLIEVHGASGDLTVFNVGEVDPKQATYPYEACDALAVTAATAGPLRVTVTGDGSSAGIGYVVVEYATPQG